MFFRICGLTTAFTILAVTCEGQDLSLSSQELVLRTVGGGPLPSPYSFQVTSSNPWKATVSNPDMLSLSPPQGSGSAKVSVSPVDWWFLRQAPGNYESAITVTDSAGTSRTIRVRLTVVERKLPFFSYVDGPKGCEDAPGLLEKNSAICTVPNEKPAGTFEPPRRGGNYIDPNFGALVRIIGSPVSQHGYSSPSAISATGRFALITDNWNSTQAVSLVTGKVAYDQIPFGIEGTLWDAKDDFKLYAFGGSAIRQYNLQSRKNEVVVDYSGRFKSISGGGTGEISKDNWVSFFAPNEKQICAANLNTQPVSTFCGAYSESMDFVTMSKGADRTTGKRYVILIGGGPFVVYAVNEQAGRLDRESRGPENVWMSGGNRDGICDQGEACVGGSHSDTFEDSAGNQFLMVGLEGQAPCDFAVYTFQIGKGNQMGLPAEAGGGMRRILPLFRCGGQDQWVDFHMGCAKSSPYCVLSTTSSSYNQARDPADKSPLKRTPYLGEIMVIRDNGAEVRRLAQHRSLSFSNEDARGYWSTPRASISPDGAYVVADSNFGTPKAQRVMSIETGFGKTRVRAEGGLVNTASLEIQFAPGVPATLEGVNLAQCRAGGVLPLPTNLCGATVNAGGTDAQLLTVSPEKIDFLWPQSTASATELTVRVSRGPASDDSDQVVLSKEVVQPLAPSLFTSYVDSIPWAMLWNPDGSMNGTGDGQRALKLGEIGVMFATGLGATTPPVDAGLPAPAEPLAQVEPRPELYINDVQQTVLFAGLVPGIIAIYQINFQLDPSTGFRDNNQVWVNVGGFECPRRTISIAP